VSMAEITNCEQVIVSGKDASFTARLVKMNIAICEMQSMTIQSGKLADPGAVGGVGFSPEGLPVSDPLSGDEPPLPEDAVAHAAGAGLSARDLRGAASPAAAAAATAMTQGGRE